MQMRMMKKLIITAAISGAEVTKKDNPNVPYTVEEIRDEARRAWNEGASIIHLHVRNDRGEPVQDLYRFKDCMTAIREACPDVIIQPTTGGAVGMTPKERLHPVYLRPEMASLDCGTMNFGKDAIFMNTGNMIREFAQEMKKMHVMPELEVFDISMIRTTLRLMKDGILDYPLHYNLVMGVKGGIGATLREFAFLVESLPEDATYTATGIGRYEFQVAAMSAIAGGHVRVGLEDNIYLEKGILAKSNGELVKKAVTIAREMGREIAAPDEARVILGLGPGGEGR